MAIEVIMPKVDMDQETGTIVEWKKNNGDQVEVGEIILVIETDKVAIDVESMDSGIIAGIQGEPGDTIPIGTVIAYLLGPDEKLPEENDSQKLEATPSKTSSPDNIPPSANVNATPVAKNMASIHSIDLQDIQGTGQKNQITKADIEAHISDTVSANEKQTGKIYATPAARRIGREKGVGLQQISGTGPGGRIQADDVNSYVPQLTNAQSAAKLRRPNSSRIEEDQVIPLIGMRRTIAERLTHSYQSIPHINFRASVDMTKFSEARAEFKRYAEKAGQPKASATAFLVKLVASALEKHPYLNASINNDNILLHKEINIGVAVALDDGLIVPVVKQANYKSISQIGTEVYDLASRAREGQLLPAEVSGGTFTISNLGPFGVEEFNAIINPPQSAILAVGTTQNEAVVLNDESIVVRPIMRFTATADHRIVDGAVAAHFVADLKALLENPILHSY